MLLLILAAVGSAVGYLYLNGKIAEGERQIAEGRKQIDRGQIALDNGKAELKAGKQELAEGKEEFAEAEDNLFLVIADTVLQGGEGFEEAEMLIADGDRQVAEGQIRIDDGEERLAAGKLEMSRGKGQLRLAKIARVAAAILAVSSVAMAITLGYHWRRSLVEIFNARFFPLGRNDKRAG